MASRLTRASSELQATQNLLSDNRNILQDFRLRTEKAMIDLKMEVAQLSQDVRENSESLDQLQQLRNEAIKCLNNLKSNNSNELGFVKGKAYLKETQSDFKSLQSKVDNITSWLHTVKDEYSKFQSTIQRTQKVLMKLDAKHKDALQKNDVLQIEINMSRSSLEDAENQLKHSLKREEELTAQIQALKLKYSETDECLKQERT